MKPVGIKLVWNQAKLDEFWRFTAERHNIFLRRVIRKEPAPWTKDKALAGAHYTNVYRELDRVTRHLVTHVLEPSQSYPGRDRLFNVLLYRAFNLPETYEALGGFAAAASWDFRRMERLLLKRAADGEKVFTGAFMVNAVQQGGKWAGPGGKVRLWVDRLRTMRLGLEGTYRLLKDTERLRATAPWGAMSEAHRLLTQLPGIGPFLAYEILVDLTYQPRPVLAFRENDWVNTGPGAVKGLRYLLRKPVAPYWSAAIVGLMEQQQDMRQEAKAELHGPDLTLRNVEHCLCEYSKYRRLKLGIHPKRTYKPSAVSADLSPWDKDWQWRHPEYCG